MIENDCNFFYYFIYKVLPDVSLSKFGEKAFLVLGIMVKTGKLKTCLGS